MNDLTMVLAPCYGGPLDGAVRFGVLSEWRWADGVYVLATRRLPRDTADRLVWQWRLSAPSIGGMAI